MLALIASIVPAGRATTVAAVRVAGADRIGTAVAVSRAHWAVSDHVVLAHAYDYPDALAGTALAARFGAPILLTSRERLPQRVADELARLRPSSVWVLGGVEAVSEAVTDELRDAGFSIRRLSGAERFATARAVGLTAGAPRNSAVVALGAHPDPAQAWPDAVSAGALVAAPGRPPLLLSRPRELPDVSVSLLDEAAISEVVVAGGPAAVGEEVVARLEQQGIRTLRLGGRDRYATSARIAREAKVRFGDGPRPLVLATGARFPDALTAGALAAWVGGILVLVPPDDLDAAPDVRALLREDPGYFSRVIVVGGPDAIADRVVEQVRADLTIVAPDPSPEPDPSPDPSPSPSPSPAPSPSPSHPPGSGPSLSPSPSPDPSPTASPSPNPTETATEVASAPSVASDLAEIAARLYSGTDPIQVGVASGAIDPDRVAVVHGRVHDRSGAPLAGVGVHVPEHPELGATTTQADGTFAMAVNGGARLRVTYEFDGHLPTDRHVHVPWRDHAWVDDATLLALDPTVTTIDLTSSDPFQVARGSAITDADGTRTATLLFPEGTSATMTLPDGSTQPLSTLRVRATEFTVGAGGPQAMPGQLPAASGYTYAVELSADEALAADATEVTFSQPISFYVEDFLGFPVGGVVPVGYYDRVQGRWVTAPNGRVIQIVDETGGMAEVDTDGDGLADDAATLSSLGLTDAERVELAQLYEPGARLWRTAITHFTPYDCNWPWGFPTDAEQPPPPRPQPKREKPCEREGSVISCQDQRLTESLPVAGSSVQLRYDSGRVPGRVPTIDIPVTGPSPPASIERIRLGIEIAGRRFAQSFAPAPNLTHTFAWDGKDAWGNRLQGPQPVRISLTYDYRLVYYVGGLAEAIGSFNRFPGEVGGGESSLIAAIERGTAERSDGGTAPLTVTWDDVLGSWDARGAGLGGWSLDVHHAYDPHAEVLYAGDGRSVVAADQGLVIDTIAGDGSIASSGDGGPATDAGVSHPFDVEVAPDGSVFVVEENYYDVRRIRPDGIIERFAHVGFNHGLHGLAVGPDGSVYVSLNDRHVVQRISPDGSTITTVAGTWGTQGYGGDGGPATAAVLNLPEGLAVGADGTLFIADRGNRRIRRIGTDGVITTVAGKGVAVCDSAADWWTDEYVGDGGPAAAACLGAVYDVDVGADGSLYLPDSYHNRVRRVTTDGVINRFAGDGQPFLPVEGAVATETPLKKPFHVAVADDGTIYISSVSADGISGDGAISGDNHWIRVVAPDGTIRTLAGQTSVGELGDGGLARNASLYYPRGMAVGHDGELIVADWYHHRIRRLSPPAARSRGGQYLVSSEDHREAYVFDHDGRHVATLDGLTGDTRASFGYDASGRLGSVSDADGNTLTVQRDSAGTATALIGPDGERTELAVGPDGFLDAVTDPHGTTTLASTADGLLTAITDPQGDTHLYGYDGRGRLISDQDPEGGIQTLSSTELVNGHAVTVTGGEGAVTVYEEHRDTAGATTRVHRLPDGTKVTSTSSPDGRTVTTHQDGTVTAVTRGPDPRWGMQAPFVTGVTRTTPGAVVTSAVIARSAALADAGDPLSATTVTDTVTVAGGSFTSHYDAAAGTISTSTPEGRTSTATLDARGRVAARQTPGLAPVRVTFDAQGRWTGLVRGTGADAESYNAAYDGAGRMSSITDPLGRTVTYAHDPAGRVTSATLPDGSTIGYGFDTAGNLTAITPPGRAAHRFEHNGLDRPSSYTPPEGAPVVAYAYDHDRSLVSMSTAGGDVLQLTTDADGRPTALDVPERGVISFSYDPTTGSPTAVTAAGQGVAYAFDGPLLIGTTWSGTVAGQVGRGYGAGWRLASETVNGGHAVAYGYDADGIVVTAGALTVDREAGSTRTAGTTVGDSTDAYAYDGLGRTSGHAVAHDGAVLYDVGYVRDALGRVTARTETLAGTTTTHAYTYDDRGRLTSVTSGGSTTTYTYDANGNRTGVSGVGAATYDGLDRLTGYAGAAYAYGASGELASVTDGSGTTTYAYDAAGALVGVGLPDGRAIGYVIDPHGRRVGRTVDGALQQGLLYRDRLAPAAELDAAGNVVSRFVYATERNVPDYLVKNGVPYRIVTDQVGSVRLVIDTVSGAVAQRIDYDAYGQVIADTNPGFQPFGFAGGLYDTDTGLVRLGARDYDPKAGRWTAPDPRLFAGGDTNLFAYAAGDPVNIADPTGEVVPLVAALGLCALGAAVNGGGQLLGQLFANGGEWSCVNLKKVGISAAVGCASGMAAPFMGSALGAAAFNGLANGVETLGHIGSDPAEAASYGALGSSVASGFVTGGLGGPAERPTNWWKSDNGVMNHAHSDDYVDIARENLSPAMSGLEFGGTALSTPNWGDGRKLNTEGCPCRR